MAAMAKTGGENFRAKYVALVHKYNRTVRILTKNHLIFKRLSRNYAILKQRLTMTVKHADREKRAIIEKTKTEKYPLILDHRRRIVFAADWFLEEIELTREELASSFYIDTLFDKFFPHDYTRRETIDIPAFHFPFMLTNYAYEGEADIHPFVHYSMEGKREFDAKQKVFLYYLDPKDISSEVELDYFQKTDKLIRRLSNSNARLQRANKTIEVHKLMLISLVCSLIEEYNRETSAHLGNIRLLTGFLTEESLRLGLVKQPPYDIDEYVKDINYTSVLHDIGKMGTPREILEKPARLTDAEFRIIQDHPAHGAAYIKKMIDSFQADPGFRGYDAFLRIPYHICLHHHERWDGTGYPARLAGETIPFCARLVALVDAYDAMRMQRSYNTPKTHLQCVSIITQESGKQFDPDLVRAFLNVEGKFEGVEY